MILEIIFICKLFRIRYPSDHISIVVCVCVSVCAWVQCFLILRCLSHYVILCVNMSFVCFYMPVVLTWHYMSIDLNRTIVVPCCTRRKLYSSKSLEGMGTTTSGVAMCCPILKLVTTITENESPQSTQMAGAAVGE